MLSPTEGRQASEIVAATPAASMAVVELVAPWAVQVVGVVAPWAVQVVGEGSVLSGRFQTLEQTLCILGVLAVKTEGEILEAATAATASCPTPHRCHGSPPARCRGTGRSPTGCCSLPCTHPSTHRLRR